MVVSVVLAVLLDFEDLLLDLRAITSPQRVKLVLRQLIRCRIVAQSLNMIVLITYCEEKWGKVSGGSIPVAIYL